MKQIMMKRRLAALGLASLLMASSLAWGQQEQTAASADAPVVETPQSDTAQTPRERDDNRMTLEQEATGFAPEADGEPAPASEAVSAGASAADPESGKVTEQPVTTEPAMKRSPALSGKAGGSLLNVMLALAAVVLMILATAWLIKRFTGFSPLNNRQLKIVASLSMGAREKVVLIEVGGEQLLLGVTPQQINHLHTLKEPVVVPNQPGQGDFAQRLQAVLNKSRSE